MVVIGLILYRWDTNMVGQLVVLTYLPQEIVARYTQYTPSMTEFITGAGIVAFGWLAFTLGVRFLNIVDHGMEPEPETQPERRAIPISAD